MLEMSLNPPEPEYYECPVCGEELPYGTYLYFNDTGECVGCEECLKRVFVEDFYEELDYFKGGEI